jgi:hypothetical protein
LKVKEEGSNVYNTVASVCDCGFGHAVRAEAVVMSSKKSNIIIVINDFKGALAGASKTRRKIVCLDSEGWCVKTTFTCISVCTGRPKPFVSL